MTKSETGPKRRSTLRRLVWIGAGLVVACVVALVAYGFMDEQPPDDSELQFTRSVVSEEENGYALSMLPRSQLPGALALTDAKASGEDEAIEFVSLDSPFAGNWNVERARVLVARHSDVLDSFDKSLERPRFQIPDWARTSQSFKMTSWRNMVDLALARAAVAFVDGDEGRAFDLVLDVIRFADRIEGGESELFVWHRGAEFKRFGLDLLGTFVQRTKLDDVKVLAVLARIDAFQGSGERGFTLAVKSGYAWTKRYVDAERAQGSLAKRFLLHRNETLRLLVEDLRPLLQLRAPLIRREVDELRELRPSLRDRLQQLRPNSMGRGIVEWQTQAAAHHLKAARTEAVALQIPRLLFALRRFLRARGTLPEKLEELLPEFLDTLPIDPFDGGTLKYSRETKEIRTSREETPLAKIGF